MKIHRFYIPATTSLTHDFWFRDKLLIHQWYKVLRLKAGEQLVLFDGENQERLYKINELTAGEAHLILVTELKRKLPNTDLYLLWSLLKKDKNDWVIQKCTEIGVSHFVPILAERSEKTGFNIERATKIAIEASEQCGRSDIPNIREPMNITTAIKKLNGSVNLLVCEQSDNIDNKIKIDSNVGVFIGPEGGWSDHEKELFKSASLGHLNLHDFTLRAETAAVAACSKLLQ